MKRKQDALDYHRRGRKGKLEVVPTKPLVSQIDLSLAYTPGVAEPCLEIAANEDMSWEYTARGNLVAVISNGTAVLGLGDIGPSAGKPVMEGKACLFKKFADIDVFDIEVNEKNVDKFVDICAARGPARARSRASSSSSRSVSSARTPCSSIRRASSTRGARISTGRSNGSRDPMTAGARSRTR